MSGGVFGASTEDVRGQQGMTARVHLLEALVNALAEYASEVSNHYNQRVGTLETLMYGADRPEPYFPSFNEWYQKRDAERSQPSATQAKGLSQIGRLGEPPAQYRG